MKQKEARKNLKSGRKYRNIRKIISGILFFSFLCMTFFAYSQDSIPTTKKSKTKYSLGLMYGFGYIFPSDKFVEGINKKHTPIDKYEIFSTRIMFQNTKTEKNPWYQDYGYPYLGIGILVGDFFDKKEMGTPISIYGFINGPFVRWKKLSLGYEIDLGLAGNWKHYNLINNQYNIAIGAERTVIFHAGDGIRYQFLPNWEAELNVGVAHFSNGAIKVPNYGLNTLDPRIEFRYHVHGLPEMKKVPLPPSPKIKSLEFTAFAGIKNVVMLDSVKVNTRSDYRGVYFQIVGFRTTFNWQISRKSKFGVGAAITYDGLRNAQIIVEKGRFLIVPTSFVYGMSISFYPSYELVIGPFSLVFQPGIYVYRKWCYNHTPTFYQRIGFKYTLAHHVTFGFNLRAFNFQVSEFIEWSVGYQLNWKKESR